MLKRAKYVTENFYVPRSRVFQEAICGGEQSVPESKVFQEAKCSRDHVDEQNVLRSKVLACKVFWGAKCVSAKLMSLSRSCSA